MDLQFEIEKCGLINPIVDQALQAIDNGIDEIEAYKSTIVRLIDQIEKYKEVIVLNNNLIYRYKTLVLLNKQNTLELLETIDELIVERQNEV